jgi:hypothetical protein
MSRPRPCVIRKEKDRRGRLRPRGSTVHRLDGNHGHPLLPTQLPGVRQPPPEARMAVALIEDALLVALGHRQTIRECTNSTASPKFVRPLWRETKEWLFDEDAEAALTLEDCCDMVSVGYAVGLTPDMVRTFTKRLMVQAFPDGVWRVRAFSRPGGDWLLAQARKALDDVAA